jgi:hypothetical protein
MKVVACIDKPAVVKRILLQLVLSAWPLSDVRAQASPVRLERCADA